MTNRIAFEAIENWEQLPDGTFVRSWGEDIFTPRTHGITIDRDGLIYDARGDLYIGEVTDTFGVQRGDVPKGSHSF